MGSPSIFYRLLKPFLDRAGMEIVSKARHEKKGFFEPALQREKNRGLSPATIIDIGASDGRWSVETATVFPKARFHMIEPLSERAAVLEALCQNRPQFSYVSAAASEQVGEADFVVSGDLDGSGLSSSGASSQTRKVPVTTVDAEVARLKLSGPFVIKLDTHGFEKGILAGAKETLAQTSLLIIEAYNFPLFPGCWRFPELSAALEVQGFRCSDLVNLVWRPHDQMLWQMDMLFKPSTSPEFSYNSYR